MGARRSRGRDDNTVGSLPFVWVSYVGWGRLCWVWVLYVYLIYYCYSSCLVAVAFFSCDVLAILVG